MEKKELQIDWSKPQLQPYAGLLVVVIKTSWEVIKRVWPFLLLIIFNSGKEGKVDKYEVMAIGFAAIALLAGVFRFFFFKFHIVNNELIVKKGWLKKGTHVVPLDRIQSVQIEQSILHNALNIVKLSIDTAGSDKTEVTIDALRKPMADELRAILLDKEINQQEAQQQEVVLPVISLTGKDLLKLSISANHIEAFLILLSFSIGIIENLRQVNEKFFDEAEGALIVQPLSALIFIICAVLVLTIFVSTANIFFKYYNFSIYKTPTGFHMKTGLANVKERVIAFDKIQFISWKANWIRKRIKLWMLEYHVTGSNDQKNRMKAKIPVTEIEYFHPLVEHYETLPDTANAEPLKIHASYIARRFIVVGLLPAIVLGAITWNWLEEGVFYFLIYTFYILLTAILFQRKFKLWSYADNVFVSKGIFGEHKILLKWYKVQHVELKQSIYQRNKGLATLILYTASGSTQIPFIPLNNAREIMNYCLYKIEDSNKKWM